jgi:hypothetical protein
MATASSGEAAEELTSIRGLGGRPFPLRPAIGEAYPRLTLAGHSARLVRG